MREDKAKEYLRLKMKEKKVSQYDLADSFGVVQGAISSKIKHAIKVEDYLNFMDALGVVVLAYDKETGQLQIL